MEGRKLEMKIRRKINKDNNNNMKLKFEKYKKDKFQIKLKFKNFMSENNNIWEFFEQRKLNHNTGAHIRNQSKFVKDPSCVICNPITSWYLSDNINRTEYWNEDIKGKFDKFWNWYQTIVSVETYSGKTIESFSYLLFEEELVELSRKTRGQLDSLIGSIRYTEIP